MFKPKNQWHCGTCSQCIDRRFAIVAAGLERFDADHDYVRDVFTGERKQGYEKNVAVDYVRHGMELHRMHENEFNERFSLEVSRAIRTEADQSSAAARIMHMHRRHGLVVQSVVKRMFKKHADAILSGGLPSTSLLSLVAGRAHLQSIWTQYTDRISGILRAGIPASFASRKPRNEREFQDGATGCLKSADENLAREFPYVRWSSSLAKPDWSEHQPTVFVEAKYVRVRRDIRRVTEEMAADITKYGDAGAHILFVVYDPARLLDPVEFSRDFLSRPNVRAVIL